MGVNDPNLPSGDGAGTFYGANIVAREKATPKQLVPAKFINGRARVFQDCVTLPDTTASGAKILMGPMPWDAVILPNAEITHEALGVGVTLKIGVVNAAAGADAVLLTGHDAATAKTGVRLFDAASLATKGGAKMLYELVGLTEIPERGMAELVATTGGAAISGDSIISWYLPYTAD